MNTLAAVSLGMTWLLLIAAFQLACISTEFSLAAALNVLVAVVPGIISWQVMRAREPKKRREILALSLLVLLSAFVISRANRLAEQHDARAIQLAFAVSEIQQSICIEGAAPRLQGYPGMELAVSRASDGSLQSVRGTWRIGGGTPAAAATVKLSEWRSATLVQPTVLERLILELTQNGNSVFLDAPAACNERANVSSEK